MTGTGDAADEDALFVLSALLLTPAQFPSVLGDDFPEACAALGLEPYERGYGLVLGQDGAGARWTVAVDDVSLVAVAIAAWDCGIEHDLSPGERTVVAALPGWPLALKVAAPDIPPPHDPEPDPGTQDTGRAPLAPPDTQSWGPAQRRLGADEIALQWEAWREQFDAGDGQPRPETELSGEDTRADDGNADDRRADEGRVRDGASGAPHGESPPPSHDGVRHVLKELNGYLETAPPLGRIRSGFASEGARMLRADGPGWSLVARTDDIAYILLDDEPNEVLPVGRGPELPKLLAALDAIAVRPF